MTEMDKHAYLIICHSNPEILRRLLELLDDDRNDIFIHVDAKVGDFDPQAFRRHVSHAAVTFIKRRSVQWGSWRFIETEMDLLKAATATEHAAYHLLSGVDLPLKTQDEIHRFFRDHPHTDYYDIDRRAEADRSFLRRIDGFYLFQDFRGRNKTGLYPVLWKLDAGGRKIMKCLGFSRIRGREAYFHKGINWFSITHELACYLVANMAQIRHDYRWTYCADEIFLPSMALNSPFAGQCANDGLRCIDWVRGQPYVFRAADYDALIASKDLFARKFDWQTDPVIIERLYRHIKDAQGVTEQKN